MIPQRNALGHWLKGQTPNPGGRPRADRPVIVLAQQSTEKAIRVLRDIAFDASQPTEHRISAAIALLERGWGKPRGLSAEVIEFVQRELGGQSGQSEPLMR
jgi:hypothetical protein